MSTFSERELKSIEWGGWGLAAASLLVALLTLIPHDPSSYWDELIRGLRGTGLVLMGGGIVWAGLAALHRRTAYFVADAPIDSQVFGVSLMVIALATVIVLLAALSAFPATPVDKLPPDPKIRTLIAKQEKALRGVIVLAVLGTATVLASFPCRRFFRQ